MFLTFEGLDASGKTTQAQILVDALRTRGDAVVHFIREPGGTVISERLREILLDRRNLDLSDLAELFLFSASRAQLVREVIAPAIARGETVICDRFYDSTTAYQGYGRGLDLGAIATVNALATAGTVPDLTLLVDVTVDEVIRRKRAAGAPADRMEGGGRQLFERVRNGYLAIAREHPDRVRVVDGMRSVDLVAADIRRAVGERQEQLH
ncbi:MAG TPA: dTMP kinase [Bacteroidota bacterium]|nr:dTMP kinase [Bacteroidota bacterium]